MTSRQIPFSGEMVRAIQAGWKTINGKKHPWAENPWLWVISFRMVSE